MLGGGFQLIVLEVLLGVAQQHVVVHVDGAAVTDGVAQAFGHHRLARVTRQAQLEEAGLARRQRVDRLRRDNKFENETLSLVILALNIYSKLLFTYFYFHAT